MRTTHLYTRSLRSGTRFQLVCAPCGLFKQNLKKKEKKSGVLYIELLNPAEKEKRAISRLACYTSSSPLYGLLGFPIAPIYCSSRPSRSFARSKQDEVALLRRQGSFHTTCSKKERFFILVAVPHNGEQLSLILFRIEGKRCRISVSAHFEKTVLSLRERYKILLRIYLWLRILCSRSPAFGAGLPPFPY